MAQFPDDNGSEATLYYTFAVNGQTLTGTLEGLDGTVNIENGSVKDSVLKLDVQGMNNLHFAGRFYGDSVTLDFKVRDQPMHIKLTRSN